MNFPLLTLPEKVLLPILQKTSYRSLSRLRRAHKNLDLSAEQNRFTIKVLANEPTKRAYPEHQVIELSITFFIATQNFGFQIENMTVFPPRMFSVTPQSLSAMYFETISVSIFNLEEAYLGNVPKSYSINNLKRVRFACSKLRISHIGMIDEETLEQLIPCFRFSKLEFSLITPSIRILHNPIIENCSEINIFSMVGCPNELLSTLRYVQVPQLDIRSPLLDPPAFAKRILEALKKDSSSLGRIEHFRLAARYDDDFDCLSQYELWKGNVACFRIKDDQGELQFQKEIFCFYVTEFSQGIMLLTNCQNFIFDIFVIRENIRETLVWRILEKLMKSTPCDFSTVFDNMLTTNDLPGAIQNFMEGFQAEYLYEPLT